MSFFLGGIATLVECMPRGDQETAFNVCLLGRTKDGSVLPGLSLLLKGDAAVFLLYSSCSNFKCCLLDALGNNGVQPTNPSLPEALHRNSAEPPDPLDEG